MRQDISDMEALISYNDGRRLGHRSISYLHDRFVKYFVTAVHFKLFYEFIFISGLDLSRGG